MRNHKIRVVFISHHSNLTGPSRGLINIVKYLDRDRFDPIVVMNRNGPIVPMLSQFVPTHVFARSEIPIRYLGGVIRRLMNIFDRGWFFRILRHFSPDLFYYNTTGVNRYRRWSSRMPVPKIMHVRELYSGFSALSLNERQEIAKVADAYIGVSQAVTDYMHAQLGISQEKLSFLHEGVDYEWFMTRQKEAPEVCRSDLGLRETDLVIGGLGSIQPRKGVDLFLEAAAQLRARFPNTSLKFIWVGGVSEAYISYYEKVLAMVQNLRLSDCVTFAGQQDDVVDWSRLLDIVVVSSRDDPLPKVVYEAMVLSKPVVAFAVGGIPEILGPGLGLMAEAIDSFALAHEIAKLIEDRDMRIALGQRGHEYAALKLDVAKNIRQIETIIENIVDKNNFGNQ